MLIIDEISQRQRALGPPCPAIRGALPASRLSMLRPFAHRRAASGRGDRYVHCWATTCPVHCGDVSRGRRHRGVPRSAGRWVVAGARRLRSRRVFDATSNLRAQRGPPGGVRTGRGRGAPSRATWEVRRAQGKVSCTGTRFGCTCAHASRSPLASRMSQPLGSTGRRSPACASTTPLRLGSGLALSVNAAAQPDRVDISTCPPLPPALTALAARPKAGVAATRTLSARVGCDKAQ